MHSRLLCEERVLNSITSAVHTELLMDETTSLLIIWENTEINKFLSKKIKKRHSYMLSKPRDFHMQEFSYSHTLSLTLSPVIEG